MRRYSKSGFFYDTIAGIVLRIVLYFVGALALIFVLMIMSAKLEPAVFNIILRAVLSAVMLYFTFFGKERINVKDVIASLAVVLTVWLPMLIGRKAGIAVMMTELLVLGVYIAYRHMFRGKTVKVLCWEWVYLLLCHLSGSIGQTYCDETSALRFLMFPIIIAIVSVPVSVFLFDKGLIQLKDARMSEAVAAVIIIAVAAFGIVYCGTCNLNYVLDRSEPIKETAIIKETEAIHGARSSISYHFTLDVDGTEIDMQVTEHEYFNFKEGDEYKIELYEGALGAPYYISGE